MKPETSVKMAGVILEAHCVNWRESKCLCDFELIAKYTVLLSPNICLTLLDLALHALFSHFLLTGIARNRLTSLTVHLYYRNVLYTRAPFQARQWVWPPLVRVDNFLFIHAKSSHATRLAATLGSKSSFRKLPRRSVATADIPELCELIAEPPEPLALRLSSNLMIGVAR